MRIDPDSTNGLSKESAVSTLQIRGVDINRFATYLGTVQSSILNEVALAIAAVIEFEFDLE